MVEIETLLTEQILLRLKYDNPWWTTSGIHADIDAMPRRLYLDMFYSLITGQDIRRSIILMGPRRVGKTVMIFHAIDRLLKDGVDPQKIVFLSIDTPIYNNVSLEQLFTLARQATGQESASGFYVFFDEIQYLKDWELHLKSLTDSYRDVKFVASGSASAALKMKSRESGAGRFTDFALPPLTFHEYIYLLGLENNIIERKGSDNQSYYDSIDLDALNQHFLNYINYGGYPEIVFSDSMKQNPGRFVRNDIVDKVLLRDLPSLYGIQDTQELYRLFVHIAFRSGSEFTYDDMSRESGIKKATIKKYVEYLEAAFLIKVINRVDANAKRMQRITTFKIYLTNPALRCAMFSPLSFNDKMMGNMVETAVFSQCTQHYNDEVYYANWKDGRQQGEVDMVKLNMATLKISECIEIKWSDRYVTETSELKSLLSFLDNNKVSDATVTTISYNAIKPMNRATIHFIPAALYTYTIGVNTIKQQKMKID